MEKRKVCVHGLNDVWINGADGNVKMCGWTDYFIGKLAEDEIEEIWNGDLAQKFRESMLDGSYRYCNPAKCPYRANGELDEQLVEYRVPELPIRCSLSYQLQCNYVCKFCRKEYYVSSECEKKKYIKIENEIKKMLPHLKILTSNGMGEFFCSNSIMKLMGGSDELPEGLEIHIETNGSLFNEASWKKISQIGDHDLTVSITVHSFDETTYQFLSGTDLPVSQIINNLKFVSDLRRKNIVNNFEIATVVCERNFRQMPEFVQKCLDEFNMDSIRLRFYEPYGVMGADVEWFYDVRNEYHPYHQEFVEIMKNPIFDNEKVWKWQGETKSLQSKSPYVLAKKNIHVLSEFLMLSNAKEKLKKFMSENHITTVAIYGWSDMGKACRQLLINNGVDVAAVFDTYVSCKERDYQVIRPTEKELNKYELVIVTSETFYDQIMEQLHRNKYNGVSLSMFKLLEKLR